jgi:hypothetical protein
MPCQSISHLARSPGATWNHEITGRRRHRMAHPWSGPLAGDHYGRDAVPSSFKINQRPSRVQSGASVIILSVRNTSTGCALVVEPIMTCVI